MFLNEIRAFRVVSNREQSGRLASTIHAKFACLVLVVTFSCFSTVQLEAAPSMGIIKFKAANSSRDFGQAELMGLIQNIGVDENLSLLKYAYFSSSSSQTFPKAKGLEVLRLAVEKESKGTNKWYALNSAYGFALLQGPAEIQKKGFETYHQLFLQANNKSSASTRSLLHDSALDLVNAFSGFYFEVASQNRTIARQALAAALNFNLTMIGQSELESWMMVIARVESGPELVALMDDVLKTPAANKNYVTMMLAATIYKPTDMERALDVLRQTKKLVPQNDKKASDEFHGIFIKDLMKVKKFTEAVKVQRERIKTTGQGTALLPLLLLANDKESEARILLTSLKQLDANEVEINQAGNFLLEANTLKDAKRRTSMALGEELLVSYLAAPRARIVEQELRAKLRVARLYEETGQVEKARAVLDLSRLTMPSERSDGHILYLAAQAKLKALSEVKN